MPRTLGPAPRPRYARRVARPAFTLRAFTLIELLVVVAIIALLIAILLPSLAGAKRQALQTNCGTNLKGIGSAMGAYASEWDILPLSQRAQYTTGKGVNQNITIRTEGSYYNNQKGLAYALSPYVAGMKSKLLVCPAVPGSRNQLGVPAISKGSALDVWDWLQAQPGGPNNTGIWTTCSYMFFSGDRGNGNGGGSNPGGPNGFSSSVAYYTDISHSVPYNKLFVPPKLTEVQMGMELAQDLLESDPSSATGLAYSNHTRGGALKSDYETSMSGHDLYAAGYWVTTDPTGTAAGVTGANVLMSDFSVTFRTPRDLTRIVGQYENNTWMYMFTGFPK